MTSPDQVFEYHISRNRLEALVDGIFAIAMTLLVLGITPPVLRDNDATMVLPGVLESLIPEVLLFILAFLVLALFWLGHHRQFHFVRQVDSRLLWINILILIAIVFVPFSTNVAGDYPGVFDAALLFHVNMFIVGILFLAQWHHIRRHEHLCEPVPEKATIEHGFYHSLLVPVISALGTGVCFVSPPGSLLIYCALPVGMYLLSRVPSP